MAVIMEAGKFGNEDNQSGDTFILTGDNAGFNLADGGENSVFAVANNDTISEFRAGPNFIYDLAQNLNINFEPVEDSVPPMTVYGFYQASGAHVTLLAFAKQTATETRYSVGHEWGTKLTISGPQQQPDTAFFAYVPHVAVVTS